MILRLKMRIDKTRPEIKKLTTYYSLATEGKSKSKKEKGFSKATEALEGPGVFGC